MDADDNFSIDDLLRIKKYNEKNALNYISRQTKEAHNVDFSDIENAPDEAEPDFDNSTEYELLGLTPQDLHNGFEVMLEKDHEEFVYGKGKSDGEQSSDYILGLNTVLTDNDQSANSANFADDVTHSCRVCNESPATAGDICSDVRHREEPQYISIVCSLCKTFFQSNRSLNLHMKMHQEKSPKSVQDILTPDERSKYQQLNHTYCTICRKSFEANIFEIHMRSVHQAHNYACKTCNRSFDDMFNYEAHLKVHTTKPAKAQAKETQNLHLLYSAAPSYDCRYCGKVFRRPYEKVKHERIHTGEKPYVCEVCSKKFRVTHSLTLHLRTHTENRPFACPKCNKTYKCKQTYEHHAKTHSDLFEYACKNCPKRFRTSVQLHAHRNTHTKPFECTHCDKSFSSLYLLNNHRKKHHSDTSMSTSDQRF